MNYLKIKFGDDFSNLEPRYGKTIEDMFRTLNPVFNFAEHIWKPQMDIYETPEEIFIVAEIAGVHKEDLEVEISSKAVKIHGNRCCESPRAENSTYRLAEIQYGRFERVLFLPALIDTDKVSAFYLDGFLKISMAKLPRDKTYKISILEN